jgi:hypothetical protein
MNYEHKMVPGTLYSWMALVEIQRFSSWELTNKQNKTFASPFCRALNVPSSSGDCILV